MKHVLHHDRDPSLGEVDAWVDVRPGDLDLGDSFKEMFTEAKKAKQRVCVIYRQCAGNTAFVYDAALEPMLTIEVIKAVLATLGQPAPVSVIEGGSQWDKY
jgi:hypothetical protein